MDNAAPVLAWVDTETSGLDPNKDSLLEVACIVTDVHLVPLADPFQAVIRYTSRQTVRLIKNSVPVVVEMHSKTGLWGRLEEGSDLRVVEQNLLDYITRVAPNQRQAHIAGNSVRFDFNFLERHMPSVAAHLNYRVVDVSTLALLSRWHLGKQIPKQCEHTALSDIQESIEELRALWAPLSSPIPLNSEAPGS